MSEWECASCGHGVQCMLMIDLEDVCCACNRIPTNKRCDWCRQDYIDSMAE